jgi:hypothetical protein
MITERLKGNKKFVTSKNVKFETKVSYKEYFSIRSWNYCGSKAWKGRFKYDLIFESRSF